MFAFDNTAVHNRVSRRIFLFFILSAVIPICTISLIAYNQINKQLESESRRQVYRESRALGLNLYDRLLSLETNLNIVANEIGRGASPDNFRNDPLLQTTFDGLALYSNGKLTSIISGDGWKENLTLAESQSGHLDKGKTALVIEDAGSDKQTLYLVKKIENRDMWTNIIAKIDTESLWDLGIHHPDLACFLTAAGVAFAYLLTLLLVPVVLGRTAGARA